MDSFISFVTVVLIMAYTGLAVWVICKCRTIGGTVGATAVFMGGGFVIIPIMEAVATLVCWAIVACVVLSVIGAALSG